VTSGSKINERKLKNGIQKFANNKLDLFKEVAALNGSAAMAELTKDMLNMVKKAQASNDISLLEVQEIQISLNKLDAEDLNKWMAGTGFSILEKLLTDFKENSYNYFASRLWVMRRKGYALGTLNDGLKKGLYDIERHLIKAQNALKMQSDVIEEVVKNTKTNLTNDLRKQLFELVVQTVTKYDVKAMTTDTISLVEQVIEETRTPEPVVLKPLPLPLKSNTNK